MARNGQVAVLFAMMLSVLLGTVGLGADLGYNFYQRRLLQNAADAAALYAVFDLSQSLSNNADCDAIKIAQQGGVPDSDGNLTDCVNSNVTITFLNDSGAVVLAASATTVLAKVNESHSTFFVGLIGIASSATSAAAKAQVQVPAGLANAPPIGLYNNQSGTGKNCGGLPDPLIIKDSDGSDSDNTVGDNGGGDGSPGTETWTATGLNPAAVGQDYVLWGPQVCQPFSSNGWKGRLAQPLPNPLVVGTTVGTVTGVAAGPTRNQIAGVGTQYWVVPVAVPNGSSSLQIVGFAVFFVSCAPSSCGNTADGVLQGTGFVLSGGSGTGGWQPGSGGLVVLRLIQ
jgi:Flp pilus assembly protein TadG